MFNIILFLESLGGGELMVILLFVLIFFGSKNIPSLARGLGKGIREFKDAMNGVQSELRQGMNDFERQVEKAGEKESATIKPAAQTSEKISDIDKAQFSEEKSEGTSPAFTPPSTSLPRE